MPKQRSWRDIAREVIYQASLEYEAQNLCLEKPFDEKQYRKWLSDRYPFGMRQYTPYKVWLDEVKRAVQFMHTDQPVRFFAVHHEQQSKAIRSGALIPNPDQLLLF